MTLSSDVIPVWHTLRGRYAIAGSQPHERYKCAPHLEPFSDFSVPLHDKSRATVRPRYTNPRFKTIVHILWKSQWRRSTWEWTVKDVPLFICASLYELPWVHSLSERHRTAFKYHLNVGRAVSRLQRRSHLQPLKRVHRDETTTTQDASFMTPTASTAIASSTGHGDSPHASNAEDDRAVIVDYNDSTPLPSPNGWWRQWAHVARILIGWSHHRCTNRSCTQLLCWCGVFTV